MVGVAGKSKACTNCKRRRVKCGFERPGCLRCAKARVKCLGYGQPTFFVNKTLADPSVSALAVLAKSSPSRIQCESDLNGSDTLSHLIALAESPTSSPRLFRRQAFNLIQKFYLPQPELVEDNAGHVIPTTWFGAVCDLEDYCPVIDHALIAFCTIQMHVTNTEGVSRDQGIEQYNLAIGRLSAALNDEKTVKLGHVLAALVVLSTCEIFCFPTDDGLRVHIQGIADIMRMESKSTDISTEIWMKLWSRLRVISVISQLSGGPPSLLSAAQWASLRSAKQNLDSIDQLIDLAYDLPRLFDSLADEIRGGDFAGSGFTTAITTLWSILRDMYSWQTIVYTNSPTPAYTNVPSGLHNTSDESYDTKLFPLSLQYSSLQTGVLLISVWAMQTHILTVLQRTSEVCGEGATIVPPDFTFLYNCFGSFQTEAAKMARLICQSIEYCHRMEMGTFGFQILLYPQWVIKQFYAQSRMERELDWCHHAESMTGPGTRTGMKLLEFQGTIKIP